MYQRQNYFVESSNNIITMNTQKTNSSKVVLVTGASSGIGKAIAKQLINDGLIVYVAARRVKKMRDLEELGAIALKMDITQEQDIKRVVEQIEREHDGVDILVNNAGYAIYGAMEDTTMEDARKQFEVNLFGLASLTKAVLPTMRAKKFGKIINISSIGGKIYSLLGSWYHATKHALEGWSDCLRLELASFNIDVIIIEPGAIQTEFGEVLLVPMMKRSGNSAYSPMAEKMKQTTKRAFEQGNASDPIVIAKVVSQAIKAKKPRTRYVAGKLAKPLVLMRKWLSDRIFDKIITNAI
jgi:NAD(P)-dependent dehydrogenase (short-subunit alcohol dehydrogenase family)